MSIEQEIKLAVTQLEELDVAGLPCLQPLLSDKPVHVHLLNTYFDTPDRKLKQHGFGLRLRRIDQQWLQTVKCSGEVTAGLHQRREWEQELAGPEFDLALLQQTGLAALVDDAAVWSAIEPVFTTDFERLLMPLHMADGSEVELAYDRGQVRVGGRSAEIHEIELELKHGELEQMQQLAETLKQALPLQYSDLSKAAQGYALLQHAEK